MAKDSKDELKKLPPEERLKRLKQLEEEKKKEIEEARTQVKEAEQELTEKRKVKEKIPIPEVALDDISALSETGKLLVKTHRGTTLRGEKKKKDEDEAEGASGKGKLSLEETLVREKTAVQPEQMGLQYGDAASPAQRGGDLYVRELSLRPVDQIYGTMKDINRAVAERGYITADESRKVGYMMQAIEKKVEDADSGAYNLTDRLAQEAARTQQIGEALRGLYLSHREQLAKDRYRSGKG